MIVVLPRKLPHECAEDISDVKGVERADFLALRTRRMMRKVINVSWAMAGLGLHAGPGAHLPSEDLIAISSIKRRHCLFIVARRIGLQELVGGSGISLADAITVHRRFDHCALRSKGCPFISVVADQERHVILLPLGKNRVDLLRQNPAINARPGRLLIAGF